MVINVEIKKSATIEDKQQLAIQLRTWIGQQKERRTREQWATFFGIKSSAFEEYIRGRAFPTGENLRKLQAKAALPALTRFNTSQPVSCMSTEAYARSVENALRRLSKELEFFKSGRSEDRQIFRRIVSAQDVGYIISLLKALFDEDAFQNWIFTAQYTIGQSKGKQGGEVR